MDNFESKIQELHDELDSAVNWVIGSAAIFFVAMVSFAGAARSPEGGRVLIFAPLIAVLLLVRSIYRINKFNNALNTISIAAGTDLRGEVSQSKKIAAWLSWPLAAILSAMLFG